MINNSIRVNWLTSLVTILVLVFSGLILQVKPVQAVTYTLTVDFLGDDPTKTACISVLANDCSLRGAIMHINADAIIPKPEYHVVLGANTYTLTNHGANEDANVTGDLDIIYSGSISIEGTGGFTTIIDGDLADRVIEVHSGILKLSMLSIRDGRATGASADGGGMYLKPFTSLELYGVDVSNNTAYFNGGGIYSDNAPVLLFVSSIRNNQAYNHGGGAYIDTANLSVIGVTFENNHNDIGDGGGLKIVGGSDTIIYASLFTGNSAYASGGGIHNNSDGIMQIYDSGFLNNSSIDGAGIQSTGMFYMERAYVVGNNSGGGAPLTFGSNFDLIDVTIANNHSSGPSAIFVLGSVIDGTLDHVTIAGNQSTGLFAAIVVYAGSVSLANSIIRSDDGNDACDFNYTYADLTSSDYNIASDESCNLIQSHDHPSTDPQLNWPGYYGGLSMIWPPSAGSIAIDNANPVYLTGDIDQRGIPRVDGDGDNILTPDIGATEFLPPRAFFPLIINP